MATSQRHISITLKSSAQTLKFIGITYKLAYIDFKNNNMITKENAI